MFAGIVRLHGIGGSRNYQWGVGSAHERQQEAPDRAASVLGAATIFALPRGGAPNVVNHGLRRPSTSCVADAIPFSQTPDQKVCMKQNRARRRWLLGAVVALLGVLVALKLFVADLYTIPQNGMYPGLPQGSRFVALKRRFRGPSDVRRGDVIVFVRIVAARPYTFVWRVIGLPGDRVEVGADSVTINGRALPHEQVRTDGSMTIYRETNDESAYEVAYGGAPLRTAPITTQIVPAGEFFVLGDKRDNAQDSRFDGTVPFTSIIARKLPR
jgi:signal peptidase I